MLQAIILSAVLFFSNGDLIKTTYKVDTKASKVDWVGKKVTGQHSGFVNLKDGSFDFTDGKLTGGAFTVDMTSITATDLEGEMKGNLEGHLKSDDFFGVEEFPTATFKVTSVKSEGTNKYAVTGQMTIKGHTETIEFPAQLVEADGKVSGTASLTIDRSKFNIRYGSGSFFDDLGDKTIYDDFELTVNIVATK